MSEFTAPISNLPARPQASAMLGLFRRKPFTSAVSILVIDVLLSMLITLITRPLLPESIQGDFITLIALSVLTAAALTYLGWWREIGFNRATAWRRLSLITVPALAVIGLPLVRGVKALPLATTLYLTAGYALTAFHEEVIFRGIILRILGPTGRARAVWLSSLLFGLAHSANLFVRSNPFLVLAQMVGAGTSGVGLAALSFETNTLWLVMGVHFFEDLLLKYTHLPAIPLNVVQSVILFGVGVHILWKRGREAKAQT